MEDILLLFNIDSVPGVVPARGADDDVRLLSEDINDFPFLSLSSAELEGVRLHGAHLAEFIQRFQLYKYNKQDTNIN